MLPEALAGENTWMTQITSCNTLFSLCGRRHSLQFHRIYVFLCYVSLSPFFYFIIFLLFFSCLFCVCLWEKPIQLHYAGIGCYHRAIYLVVFVSVAAYSVHSNIFFVHAAPRCYTRQGLPLLNAFFLINCDLIQWNLRSENLIHFLSKIFLKWRL